MTQDFDLKFELYVALKEQFGSTSDWPAGFGTARNLLCAVPLNEQELHRYLHCARQASMMFRERTGPSARLYRDCLVLALVTTYEIDDQDQDRDAAWHILLAIHGMLKQQAFDRFVDCAISVLEPEREAVGA